MYRSALFTLILLLVPFAVQAEDATSTPDVATSTPPIATTTPPLESGTATLTIRSGDITAFSGQIEIAASTSQNIAVTPTNASSSINVPADSLLASLLALDATTADFDITDLAYHSSFDSFIINCIAIPSGATPICFNWTYAVNGSFPQIGVDDQILHDGDVVHLFFGPQRKSAVSTSSVIAGEEFTATALSYDLSTGQYVGAPGLTLGVGTPNSDFTFTEIATSTSDADGNATFAISATGTFAVGIQEDFYFPTVSITIADAPATSSVPEATSTPPTAPPENPGGGGGGIVHSSLNVPAALSFLASKQNADGSYNSSTITDWAAIAFAAADPGAAKTKLHAYLLTATPIMASITDYERHAMALQALGIDPYSGTPVDYITPIVNAFDGTQIGDPALVNDDIFGLYALLKAGFGQSDVIVQKTGAFVLSKQLPNGSWDDPDMTAAAAQIVGMLFGTPGITSSSIGAALGRASGYLSATEHPNASWGLPAPTGSIDSTSWVQTMINSTYEFDPAHAAPYTSFAGYFPTDYIAQSQQQDGGVRSASDPSDFRVWSTSYSVVAASGKSWLSSLKKFAKPSASSNPGGGGGSVLGNATSTAATSTLTTLIASSTEFAATSTISSATTTLASVIVSTSTISAQDAATSTRPSATISAKKTAKVATKAQKSPPTPVVPSIGSESERQVALVGQAAAQSSSQGFLRNIWSAITSFVARFW